MLQKFLISRRTAVALALVASGSALLPMTAQAQALPKRRLTWR
jgi:hypothetical protein